jgi:hypothetical protein
VLPSYEGIELRWRGSNSISVSGHYTIKEGAVYCTMYMKSQVEGAGGGLDNLLMSMYSIHSIPYRIPNWNPMTSKIHPRSGFFQAKFNL